MTDITEEDAHLLFKILANKLGAVDVKLQQFGNIDGKPFYEVELITADGRHHALERYIPPPLKNYDEILPTFIGGFSWKDIFERALSIDSKKVGFITINDSMFISFPSIEEAHLMLDLEN